MTQPQPFTLSDFPFNQECRALLDCYLSTRGKVLDLAVDHPAESLVAVLAGAAWVFYEAEREANPEVQTYGDALHYISTCLSVGYARIFPVTQTGKLIATIVMAIGPSLSSWLLEGRLVQRQAQAQTVHPPVPPPPELTAVVHRLDAILRELQSDRA